ncbi:MAG: hypothetical protein K2Q18_04010 [Bdellovibrionales bacterium]|nr:hypothetical protein [Bdellovibrionales bacterium]
MLKRKVWPLLLAFVITSCATNAPMGRGIASWRDSSDGSYYSKDIRNDDGQIDVLREFDLMQSDRGRNFKGLIIEVMPINSFDRMTMLQVNVNGRPVENFNVKIRLGRQHFFAEVNQEIGEGVRDVKVVYNRFEVSVKSITTMINDDRRPDPGPGPVNPGPNPWPNPNPGPKPWPNPGPGPVNPNPWPNPNPGPGPGGRGPEIQVFSDDRCTNVITDIRGRDNCSRLNPVYGSRNVWSVTVDRVCYDVQDTSFNAICPSLDVIASGPEVVSAPSVMKVFKDDRCTNLLIDIKNEMDCNAWMPVMKGNAWSILASGKCIDIQDALMTPALCENFKRGGNYLNNRSPRPDLMEAFSDDRCTVPVTFFQRGDDCDALNTVFGGAKVWSLKVRGRCEDIQDLAFPQACQNFTR